MMVHKSKVFATTKSFLYTRGPGGENVAVKYHPDISLILGQEIVRNEAAIFPRIGPYTYMATCPYSESKNLEFKCFNSANFRDLIERISTHKMRNTILAMGNICGGGEIVIGIKEVRTPPKRQKVVGQTATGATGALEYIGQELEINQEEEFLRELAKKLEQSSPGTRTLWGNPTIVPVRGTHWDCKFIPLGPPPYTCQPTCRSVPHMTRRVLICIRIFQCPGGLFAQSPESFELMEDGDVVGHSFDEWRDKHILHTRDVQAQPTQRVTKPKAPRSLRMPRSQPAHGVLEDVMKLSFKYSSWGSELQDREYTDQHMHKALDIFESSTPIHLTPSREEIDNYLYMRTNKALPSKIDEELRGQCGFGIADESLFSCIENDIENIYPPSTVATESPLKPPSHIMDILVISNITQIFLYVICSSFESYRISLLAYTMIMTRILKKKILKLMAPSARYESVHIMCRIMSLDGSPPHYSPDYYHGWFTGLDPRNFPEVCSSLAGILSAVPSHFRDEIRVDSDVKLCQQQLNAVLALKNRFTFIEYPPGCGKMLVARHVCEENGREDSAYISGCVALNQRLGATGDVNVFYAQDSNEILSLLQNELRGKVNIVIDDNHNYTYTVDVAHQICKAVAVNEMHLYVFQDSKYQNYKAQNAPGALKQVISMDTYGSHCIITLREIQRNSQVVGSFLTAQVSFLLSEHSSNFKCLSALRGDDVTIQQVIDLRIHGNTNGLLQHLQRLLANPLDTRSRRCTVRDIVVLVDDSQEVHMYRDLFNEFWHESRVHGAELYPVEGVIIDTLDNYAGLDSKVVVCVLPRSFGDRTEDLRTKYIIAAASRGIERVDILQEEKLDTKIVHDMQFDKDPQV